MFRHCKIRVFDIQKKLCATPKAATGIKFHGEDVIRLDIYPAMNYLGGDVHLQAFLEATSLRCIVPKLHTLRSSMWNLYLSNNWNSLSFHKFARNLNSYLFHAGNAILNDRGL